MTTPTDSSANNHTNQLPDLHKQAYYIKNHKRLQHDGGRAWIKDGQLHEAVKGVNYRIERGRPVTERLKESGLDLLEQRTGTLISKTNTARKL